MFHIPNPNRSSVHSLYFELRGRVLMQGIESYDQYIDLVEELLAQKLGDGEFDKHEDLEQIKNNLEMLWPDIEREVRYKM